MGTGVESFGSSGGKGNSRSQTATNTTTQTTQSTSNTVDNRVAEGDGAILGGNTSLNLNQSDVQELSVQVTDLGAVAGSLNFASRALDSLLESNDLVQQAQGDLVGRAYALAEGARQSETSGALQSSLKYAAIVIGLAILAFAVTKSAKR